jgi:acetyltransferase-like isoleucine patch superfamily enzyme
MRRLVSIFIGKIYKELEKQNIQKVESCCVLGLNSKLHKQSTIDNHANNRDLIVIGRNTHVRGELLVFAYGGNISIGNDCYVGEGTRIWSGENVQIGNSVLISHNCNIIDTNSHELNYLERHIGYVNMLEKGHPQSKGSILTSKIVIHDNAWISFNCIILKGVTIGKGAVVAAGSVVTKDVEPFTVVAGNPAKFVKDLKQSYLEKIKYQK